MTKTRRTPIDHLALFIAWFGYSGRLPGAPGTWGSLAAALLAPWCFLPLPLAGRLGLLALVLAIGTWAAGRAETLLGQKDPGSVVIDEVLGQWIAYLPLAPDAPWMPLAAGFLLFRVFDILKPWPVRTAETAFPGGLGVMADDAVAGVYALLCLWLGAMALASLL